MATEGALVKWFRPLLGWAAKRYQAAVGAELKKYGLRYEDLLDPQNNLDVEEALRRLPQAEVDARNQRLKRAADLSLKKAFLEKHLQEKQTPWAFYITPALQEVEAENQEKFLLGTGKMYERSIP